MTSAPLSVAYSTPCMMAPKVPLAFLSSTLTDISRTCEVTPAARRALLLTVEATCVPW